MLAQSAAGAGLGMKDVLEGVGSRARRAEGVAKGYPVGQAASPGWDCSPWLPAGIQEAAGIPSSSRGRCCGAENARKCPATAVPALPTSAAHPPAAFLLASACSSPWPWRTELRGDSRSCAGIHGVWSRGKRLLMCSTAHAWLAGRPCPPSPAPHVGKRIGMLRGCSGNARRGCSGSAWGCSRGCSGGTQRMPGGMPRRVWSIQQPNTLLRSRDHLWPGGPLAATGPQALASAPRRGRGGRGGLCSPRAHPRPRMGLRAAVQQLQPRSLPGSWRRGCPPSPSLHRSARSACSKPGCRASERDAPSGGATTRSSAAGGAARGAGTPRNSGQWGGRAPTAWGPRWALDPCKAGEAPLPPRMMSQAGIPVSGWGGTLGTQVLAKPGRHRRLVG